MRPRRHHPRWRTCNVLHPGSQSRTLWQFAFNTDSPPQLAAVNLPLGQPIPTKFTRRGWRQLWHPTLNLAWLPADHVHLRVVHLPKCGTDELRSMLELQLEKLSPAPVNQIVWTFEVLPHPIESLQTAVLIIAERPNVESFLTELEKESFITDKLEIPWLHQLLASPPNSNGTWIYLAPHDLEVLCLVTWWYDGTLQHIDLLRLPNSDVAGPMLADHLTRVSWGAEIDGWLNSPPSWHLVSFQIPVDPWIAAFRTLLGDSPEIHTAPELHLLAQLAARRNARRQSTANLLPAEFTARYQQQLVDRLWMRGLGAVVLLYLLALVVYFASLQFLDHRNTRVQREVAFLSNSYTNALQLRERVRLFEEQADLKYAALDCLRIAAELLPPELILDRFTFQGGKAVVLSGTVSLNHQLKVTEFNAELRKSAVNGVPLFKKDGVRPPTFTPQPGARYAWNFTADLHRTSPE